MKQIGKLILIATLPTLTAVSAAASNEKLNIAQSENPAFRISAFTLKSADGKIEMKMDAEGKMYIQKQHVATANQKGEIHTPNGKLIMRVKANGELEPDVMGAPIKIKKDGTLTGAGEAHAWKDGKFIIPRGHLEISPKDSPSLQAATLFFVLASMQAPVAP